MKHNHPRISVIMPLYNAEKFVAESIESILGQTFQDFELIIINDCSTDNSWEVACSYAKQDSRIHLLQNETNQGAADTRNRGLDIAQGDFITFMDADDLIAAERFERLLAYFNQHPEVDLCGTYYAIFHNNKASAQLVRTPISHEQIVVGMLFGCPFAPTVMMRSEAFRCSGVRFQKSMAEDFLFWVELSGHMRMANLPECLSFYRRWDGQISTRAEDAQTASAQEILRNYLHQSLGIELNDHEAQLYTFFSQSKGHPDRSELKNYRNLLLRLYRTNAQVGRFNRRILKKQLLRRYKVACRRFYPSWQAKIMKRLLSYRLCF